MKKLLCVVVEFDEGEDARNVLSQVLNAINEQNGGQTFEGNLGKMEIIPLAESTKAEEPNNYTWEEKLENIMTKLGVDICYKGYKSLYYIMECIDKNPEYKLDLYMQGILAYAAAKTGYSISQIDRQLRTMADKIYVFNTYEKIGEVLNIEDTYLSSKKLVSVLVKKVFK